MIRPEANRISYLGAVKVVGGCVVVLVVVMSEQQEKVNFTQCARAVELHVASTYVRINARQAGVAAAQLLWRIGRSRTDRD